MLDYRKCDKSLKATELSSAMLDPPPPYTDYELDDDNLAGDRVSPARINAIPRTRIHTVTNAGRAGKLVNCHYCSYCMGGAVAIIICLFVTITVFPYPLQASCDIQWHFGDSCTHVMQRLRCQILKWTNCNDCGLRGNKCLYSLKEPKSRENNTIRATHLSPNLKLIDDIRIEFSDTKNRSCVAKAKSVSRSWFLVFDYGTNYCNLRNLVEGAGLYIDRGFGEFTNDTVCTQSSTAVCA